MATRSTKQKSLIIKTLERARSPLSAMEIYNMVKKLVPSVNKTTVYRQLEKLLTTGQLSAVNTGGRALRYELSDDHDHHHHFHCVDCDAVVCLQECSMKLDKMLPRGFKALSHDLTIHGQCKECRSL